MIQIMYHKIYFILSPLIHYLICLGSYLLELRKEVGHRTLNPASVVCRHILNHSTFGTMQHTKKHCIEG